MINQIRVSGFKSLHDFSLSIRPGLNVLVGPNGAGKSNIIEAFEFLSYLVQSTVGDAFGKLGGAGRVLSKMPEEKYAERIAIEVAGEKIITSGWYNGPSLDEVLASKQRLNKFRMLGYTYRIELEVTKTAILIAKEVIQGWLSPVRRIRGKAEVTYKIDRKKAPPFEVVRTGISGADPKVRVRARDDANEFHREVVLGYAIESIRKTREGGSRSVISGAPAVNHPIVAAVRSDLVFESPLNVIPDRVRMPADIAAEPGIERDGAGFAATLWAHQRGTRNTFGDDFRFAPWRSRFRRRRKALESDFRERLADYVRRVNPDVTDIEAVWEAWESKIGVRCTISSGVESITVPIAALSDGTLKWMALVAAIMDRDTEFAIEEPENHVHPAVQKELVAILRERFSRKDHAAAFMLLSTHSESLLNALDPVDIVVISMDQGRTKATRLSSVQSLNEEIARTGFGLGHYYMMGALDD